MPSTLPIRRIREEDIFDYANVASSDSASRVSLPNFANGRERSSDRQHYRNVSQQSNSTRAQNAHSERHISLRPGKPYLVPTAVPARQSRQIPLVIRANRALRTVLVAFCGIAIVGYGLDVAASNDVGRLQEQARRLNEQNSELSAQLLRAISFQDIQKSVVGRFGLRVPEQVIIAQQVTPPEVPAFKNGKHHLPLMSGY